MPRPALEETIHRELIRHPEENRALVLERLRVAGLPSFPMLLRPGWVAQAHLAPIAAALAEVSSAISKVGRAFLLEGRFEDRIGLPPAVKEAARADARFRELLLFSRYDAIYDSETGHVDLLEINAGDPSGMGWNDVLVRAFRAMPAMQTAVREHPVESPLLIPSKLAHLTRVYRDHCARSGIGAREAPRMGFLGAHGSIVRSDHEAVAAFAREGGFEAIAVDPRELRFDGERLTGLDRVLDVVLRDTVDEIFLEPFWPAAKALMDAYRSSKVAVVNPFCTVFADRKAVFDVLTDPDEASLFTASERAAIAAHVLPTRSFSERRAWWEGRKLDLVPFVRAHREKLVLKPDDGYGGFGVRIGPDLTQSQWDLAIAEALRVPGSHVVQAFKPLPVEDFPIVDSQGAISLASKRVIHSFWQHGSQTVGGFIRVSNDSVINVHQGGGLMPVFYVH